MVFLPFDHIIFAPVYHYMQLLADLKPPKRLCKSVKNIHKFNWLASSVTQGLREKPPVSRVGAVFSTHTVLKPCYPDWVHIPLMISRPQSSKPGYTYVSRYFYNLSIVCLSLERLLARHFPPTYDTSMHTIISWKRFRPQKNAHPHLLESPTMHAHPCMHLLLH